METVKEGIDSIKISEDGISVESFRARHGKYWVCFHTLTGQFLSTLKIRFLSSTRLTENGTLLNFLVYKMKESFFIWIGLDDVPAVMPHLVMGSVNRYEFLRHMQFMCNPEAQLYEAYVYKKTIKVDE